MKWFVTGDTHGVFNRFSTMDRDEHIGTIILGDVGINVYGEPMDGVFKKQLNEKYPNIEFFCVRGNHEARPEGVQNIKIRYNRDVSGYVWEEEKFPQIHYFMDGGEYNINGKSVLVLGGAQSVDKEMRLINHYPWFEDEELTDEEMQSILERVQYKEFDFVFSHTCPISWIDKPLLSNFENRTEKFLETVKTNIEFGVWAFGHFHDDLLVRPTAVMLYENIMSLDHLWYLFHGMTQVERRWYPRSKRYYMGI